MPVEGNAGGLAAAEKLYKDYGGRARELKKQGGKAIGYICAFTPVEVITAAGFIPFRIKGSVNEPITRADTQMETIICPLVRSCFDLSLKNNYDFLDGLVRNVSIEEPSLYAIFTLYANFFPNLFEGLALPFQVKVYSKVFR